MYYIPVKKKKKISIKTHILYSYKNKIEKKIYKITYSILDKLSFLYQQGIFDKKKFEGLYFTKN